MSWLNEHLKLTLIFRYHRCQFELPLYPENTSTGSQQYISTTPFTVTAFTKWDEVVARVKPSERPVVLNRASSTNTTNPFGSTFCYGTQVRNKLK